ncbi:MAG: AbrB/MazE/SpoVT family DNA-binding domain-containing protein [Chloroflexota bacterium]|nr:AbrB/MazE/SpoVT family DNA-binding domain-containing protein [Chloroflexota bacterium]
MSERGQVVIPVEARREMGLEPGTIAASACAPSARKF